MVDIDVLPDTYQKEKLTDGLRICRLLNGNYISKDVLEEFKGAC